ncbi:T9SS type A sorting domain-containing protein [Fluviicola sp.]|uniref:T9SS type A sorting domain-containing protein n=1 Tax=Fluviicola sp. TaxID=1917219 RepID=UPI003D2B7F3F
MKTISLLILFLVFSKTLFAQCPTAGSDSAVSYCKYEVFDVASLRSTDADLGGAFMDFYGDTMFVTTDSLFIPGIYNYSYKVSELGCADDSAKYVITIVGWCDTGGVSEAIAEDNSLIQTNPVIDQIILNEINYDQLEIYETSGRRVLLFSTYQSIIDISQLERGNYILVLDKNGTKQFQRFIKY